VHERFRHVDAKLDKVIDAVAEIRIDQAAMLNILASHDTRMLRMEIRLGSPASIRPFRVDAAQCAGERLGDSLDCVRVDRGARHPSGGLPNR
jgi:hypothetical protein